MSRTQEPLSKACMQATSKNAHCQNSLKHELGVLDMEKEHTLQNIRHDVKQFKEQSGLRPTSGNKSRAVSANTNRGGTSNPGSAHESSEGSETPNSPKPSSQRKNSSAAKKKSQNADSHTQGDSDGAVPQIVVSKTADKPQKKRKGPNLARRGSVGSHGRPSSGSGSDTGFPLSQSLNFPNGSAMARRLSHCPDPSHSSTLGIPDSARARSSSFSSIDPARRRGSVMEQWGSISERNRPAMGSFKGRRGSVDMENLLRDLSFGVQHSELMSPTGQGHSVTDKQWEELKKCRYLRVPSRDNSTEDINEEAE